jgi:hypothetical protein
VTVSDAQRAMRMAVEEIRSLRRRNEILEAKVEVMNLFGVVFHTQPTYPTQGMGEDAAWLLEREIERANAPDAARPPTAT